MSKPTLKSNEASFAIRDYDLAATLGCGQAFRWEFREGRWLGIVGKNLVALEQHTPSFSPSEKREGEVFARTSTPQDNWRWLEDYLQIHADFPAILATFPQDAPMQKAVAQCRGLRLLRQETWECLASFILSSTKQIVQIRQIVARLCERHGEPIAGWDGQTAAFAFPTAEQIARLSEAQLRECKMGFRAPYLLAAARSVASGELDLAGLGRLELAEARVQLLGLPGVGPKIADCVLLFACGFPTAFPVDVWVMRALRQAYFRNHRVPLARLRDFSATHFGPYGGYAQQYLFHALRLGEGKKLSH